MNPAVHRLYCGRRPKDIESCCTSSLLRPPHVIRVVPAVEFSLHILNIECPKYMSPVSSCRPCVPPVERLDRVSSKLNCRMCVPSVEHLNCTSSTLSHCITHWLRILVWSPAHWLHISSLGSVALVWTAGHFFCSWIWLHGSWENVGFVPGGGFDLMVIRCHVSFDLACCNSYLADSYRR